MRFRVFGLLCGRLLLAAVLLAGCKRGKPAAATPPPEEQAREEAAAPAEPGKPQPPRKPATAKPRPSAPPPAELWKEFSGEKALALVQQQVEFGPRPSGSAENGKAREHIIRTLKAAGWRAEPQPFTEQTPHGAVQFVNVVARYGEAAKPEAIVCSHFDTKRFSTIQFVGASDGASSTGALLELARVLALDPALAARVELVFFDGEEAVQQFTATDGLYGSRYYARQLRAENRAGQYKFAVLWDMIGDKDLTITMPPDSPRELSQSILDSAAALGVRDNFSFYPRDILDDHVPLNQAGIPAVDLIDFFYMPWHTADDTLDKLSAESLRKVGQTTVHFLKQRLR